MVQSRQRCLQRRCGSMGRFISELQLRINNKQMSHIKNRSNYLLLKDDVGKARPTTRELPSKVHSYGYACKPDKEGVSALLTNWTFHNQSLKQQTDKDFAALNRLAIKNKATNCREQYDFRQTVNARLRDPLHRRDYGSGIAFDENQAYGNPNRPSTPIKAVVEGFFGDVAEQQTLARYELVNQKQGRHLSELRNHTRASQLAQSHIKSSSQVDFMRSSKGMFKMTKFRNVSARTNTHNNKRPQTAGPAVSNVNVQKVATAKAQTREQTPKRA